ncbi:MAG: Mut7-C RNAse domain-containing protein, partial [Candidatus Limnocylindrales bacterium]
MVVRLRFHGALNDLLPVRARGRFVGWTVRGSPAVKDVIESLGVPHVEVGRITADGRPVSLGHRVRDGERIAIYPPSQRVPSGAHDRRAGQEGGDPQSARFVVDGHLGRLAAYLRMLGFDTLYAADMEDAVLAELAARDDRILLSRDRGLLK